MKEPALRQTILAHLRGSAAPVSSRDLAGRFLRIRNADESTCHRLLAPLLAALPGVEHHPECGWSFAPPRSSTAPFSPATISRVVPEGGAMSEAAAMPVAGTTPVPLDTFVAIAAEGAGPGGSGALRCISLLPVVAGDECQEEHLPSSPGEDDPADIEAAAGVRSSRARPGVLPGLCAADLESLVEMVGELPVVCHRASRDLKPIRRACAQAGHPFHPRTISLSRLGNLLLGLKRSHALLDLAGALSVESRGPDDCRGRVRLAARCFLQMIPRLEAFAITSTEALLEFQSLPAAPLDLSRYDFSAEDLKALPTTAGVYRFLDRHGEVIYIGKARNLRTRVASYFIPSARGTGKGRAILDQVHALGVEPVSSELEAILVEAALLAEHRPRLNRQFDVHERPAPYGPRLNVAVVLPDQARGKGGERACSIHLMRGGRYLRRVGKIPSPRSRPGGHLEGWSTLTAQVAAAYFSGSPGSAPAGTEVDWQLVSTFLRKHRDEVNVLDVDECPSVVAACERLEVLVEAALTGGGHRVLAR